MTRRFARAALLCGTLAAIALACAAPERAAAPVAREAQDSFADVEGFVAPRRAEDFELATVQVFEQREAGTGARYTTFYVPSARIDLFVFPVIVPDLFSLSDALGAQQQEMLREIEQSSHGALDVASQSIAAIPGATPPLVGIRTDLRGADSNGLAIRSHAFLAIRGRHYLKVRFSYPAEVESVAAPAFDRFLASVVAPVAASPAGDPVDLGMTITRTTWEIAGHDRPCAAIAWGLGYGSELLAALDRGEFADTFERERAARSKALDVWEHLRRDGTADLRPEQCVDPTLDAMSEVRRRGLFDAYVWRFHALPYWTEPPGLDLDAFAAFEKRALAGHDPVREAGVVIRFESEKTP